VSAYRATRTRRVAVRRRRIALVIVAAVAVGAAVPLFAPLFEDAVKEVVLPLRHEDIIRQQARQKSLDPSLIAAVIYAESRFREGQTSPAGAQGLMQITPDTAKDIARRSGGVAFEVGDLHTPQVNIAYGAYHLRFLLDHYGGNEMLAVAAYNGGQGNVDRWLSSERAAGRDLRVAAIPFPETRTYVSRVFSARRDYRHQYRRELGL
jgi:soluble lytic murein transglycosylase